ncbi:ABC transporter ATP-binding protein [Caldalkalibacillus thermarum]|uniref:ABC transporter ATP-binding protein n=1 Tax=Caldalkalibacillus thermarum TaxID=296745 RepID=UPI00166CC104|nr:ABC transporter ATP-binding protein [Caldalkalibacillus thermarum]GGK16944.1 ABC transporter ATP-binding protein [Caldalkalibacillus thermarum]GGK26115.1 ABC transporter ATP-binding protein [Caldalkalibacillus thermarum]
MRPLLQVEHVTGGYTATKPVIHDISFDINAGEIVSLIGLNGAGKSTTIKHILGLLSPHEGSIMIDGCSFKDDPDRYRSLYSYIPESPVYYEELNLWEHLELAAMAYGLDRLTFEKRAEHLLQEFRMEKKKHQFPAQFSKGMKQKLMIMMAFLVQPKLYIVDEPLLGLDPLGIRSLLEWLVACKEKGAGILMSTHILATAERYCDRFVIIHEGRIRAKGTLEELRQMSGMPAASLDDIYLTLTEVDER